MAKKNDNQQAEKKPGILEKWGIWETKDKKEGNGTSSETNEHADTPFIFDFSEAAQEIKSPSTVQIVQPAKTISAPISVIDPKIAEKLRKVLTDSNFPGPDYFEFKEQLSALEEIIPDETTRFRAAFKSVKGITKDKITQSAGKYVEILISQNTDFSTAISESKGKDIEFKTQEAKVLNTENLTMQTQIDELKAKIEANKQRIQTLGLEVQKTNSEIADAKRRFEGTLSKFVNDIKTDAQKADTYIK